MKTGLITILLASVVMTFTCCIKHDGCHQPQNTNAIHGQWRWSFSHGGIAGITINPSTDSIVTLTLKSNLTYIASLNNSIAAQGIYSRLAMPNNISVLHFDKQIVADRLYLQQEQQIVKNTSDSLFLFDYNVSDGMEHVFVKMK